MAVKTARPKGQWKPGQVVEEGIQYRGPYQFRVQIRERDHNISRTFETLDEARGWKAETEQKLLGRSKADPTLPERTTVAVAAHWGITELLGESPERWTMPNDKNHVSRWRWWRDKSPFRSWMIADVNDLALTNWVRGVLLEDVGDDIEDAADALAEIAEMEGCRKPVSRQTITHRLNSLNKLVQEWRLANSISARLFPDPVVKGVRPAKGKGRRRRLSENEEKALATAAAESSRSWLSDAVTLAIETGCRQTELATLTWNRVFFDDEHPYIHLPTTKNGRERNVPLSDRAIEALAHLKVLADDHNANPKSARTQSWDKPLPVASGRGVIHAFRDAIADYQAGGGEELDDLRWHDLRHEAVSRFFELTNLRETEIMAIVGHLSRGMLEHYATLRTKQFRDQLPTADGAKGDPPGTVKLRPGKPAMVKTMEGKWVRLESADEFITSYARKLLEQTLAQIT